MLSRNGYFPRPRRVPWSCSLGVAAASDVGTAEDATDAPALAPICAPGGVDATALVGPRERNMALAVAAAAAVVVVERGGRKTAAHADRNAAAFLGARLALPHAPRLARCTTHWLCATASDGFKLQDAAARVPRSLLSRRNRIFACGHRSPPVALPLRAGYSGSSASSPALQHTAHGVGRIFWLGSGGYIFGGLRKLFVWMRPCNALAASDVVVMYSYRERAWRSWHSQVQGTRGRRQETRSKTTTTLMRP